jgi:signal transduction histidine kinase
MPNQNREYFDVIKYIQSAINIIQATLIYHNIKLEIISPKEHIEEYGYPSEFSQVILNLLDNAKDILVERRVKEPKIVIEIEINKNNTIINIKDNGGGIDEKHIDKIFDIYFSTKLDKGGSGLGLYISKLIIEKKGMGRLKVSNGKEGAIFSIFL